MTFLNFREFNIRVFVSLMLLNLILALIVTFSYNTDVRGVEPNVIYTIQSIHLNNSNLYTDPEQIPYAITQYMPLYYIVCDKVISFLRLSAGRDVYLIYMTCRFLSFFVSLWLLFFIGKISYNILHLSNEF